MDQPTGPEEGQGGGIVEALLGLDKGLASITGAAASSPEVPPEAKQAFQTAADAFRQGLQLLMGGGAAPQAAPQGAVSMEQGASKGAIPHSMGRPA